MGRVAVPVSDYVGDTKGALDNSVRVLQAITDLTADAGWLGTTLSTMHLIQGLMQVERPPMLAWLNYLLALTAATVDKFSLQLL